MGTGCLPTPNVEMRDEASAGTVAAAAIAWPGVGGVSTLAWATGNEKPSTATRSGAKDLSRARKDAMPDLDCNIGAGTDSCRAGRSRISGLNP